MSRDIKMSISTSFSVEYYTWADMSLSLQHVRPRAIYTHFGVSVICILYFLFYIKLYEIRAFAIISNYLRNLLILYMIICKS